MIIEAIVDGDPELAASATQVHLRQSQKATLEAAKARLTDTTKFSVIKAQNK